MFKSLDLPGAGSIALSCGGDNSMRAKMLVRHYDRGSEITRYTAPAPN
jgi:hypothetical protein